MKDAVVVSVSSREAHAPRKDPRTAIEVVEGHGVRGDAHFGETVQHRSRVARDPTQPNLRQVHLLHSELLDELATQGISLVAGDFGENILTRSVDLLGLSESARLHVGDEVVLEVTGLRNPCPQLDEIAPGLMKATLDRDADGKLVRKAGIMSIVVRGGHVRVGDAIEVVSPEEHRPLAPV